MMCLILGTVLIVAAIALAGAYLWMLQSGEVEQGRGRWILVAWTVCLIGAFVVHALGEVLR